MKTLPLALVLLLGSASAILAQAPYEYWPGARYDPAIPTVKAVLGYEPGERITSHTGLTTYLDALARVSPRIRVVPYGESWEGKRLVYAVIASEENMRRLEAVQSAWRTFADPRVTRPADAPTLAATLPAIVWLGYGVHGNEISSPDAALMTAYHLLAAENDPLVQKILKNDIVLIDPTQNPDGRDRFVHFYEQNAGLEPSPSQVAAEHVEPWPGARTNHYFFDLNRDWLTASQPETRGRIRMLKEWMPVIAIDLHEMGSDSTYYFTPEADPYNPFLPGDLKNTLEVIGRNNAKWFDQFGFDYFTRDTYDNWYPGYGASWPMYYGGIAATYEQASTRGLVVRKADGSLMRYRDTVRHHFVASISTLEVGADHREKFITALYNYRRAGIEDGQKDAVREYLLPPGHDPSATLKLAGILSDHGIEVRQARSAFTAARREYPAGTFAVSTAQPARRFVHTLLDPQTPFEQAFLREQERRRQRRVRSQIYDITAWSLPLLFNVDAIPLAEEVRGDFIAVQPRPIGAGRVTGGKATVAYLVPWGTQAAGRFLTTALRLNLRVWSADEAFTVPGRTFPAGTLIVKVNDNDGAVHNQVSRLAETSGADVVAANSGWTEEGPNFGSNFVQLMRKPEIAIAWDTPSSAASAGAARFVLERQFGYPTTPVRVSSLGSADLGRFTVLVLPDVGAGDGAPGSYATALGAGGIENIKRFVAQGGVVVGISGALALLTDTRAGLLSSSAEGKALGVAEPAGGGAASGGSAGSGGGTGGAAAAGAPGSGSAAASGGASAATPPRGKILATEADLAKAILPASERPDQVPGAIVRGLVNQEFWATVGVPPDVYGMYTGRGIYTPLTTDKGTNAVTFAGPDQVLASGYMWEENRRQLAYKPLMMVATEGRGIVVGFTVDPNFRAYVDGMNLLFLNAVFRGAAHARQAP
ncbi:MAG TPA: M14 family zinc carboxypeptidase [Vicinamibacterales bacterium]|nr:M14 family zinc carboxypeptidase [Vicinamibacterales bacterium]